MYTGFTFTCFMFTETRTQLQSMSMDQHITQSMHIANRQRLFLLVGSCLGCTLEATCSPGSNETNLLSRGCIPAYCGCVTNMLMVTTTVRVLYRVHSHTTNLPSKKRMSGSASSHRHMGTQPTTEWWLPGHTVSLVIVKCTIRMTEVHMHVGFL